MSSFYVLVFLILYQVNKIDLKMTKGLSFQQKNNNSIGPLTSSLLPAIRYSSKLQSILRNDSCKLSPYMNKWLIFCEMREVGFEPTDPLGMRFPAAWIWASCQWSHAFGHAWQLPRSFLNWTNWDLYPVNSVPVSRDYSFSKQQVARNSSRSKIVQIE